MGKKLSELTEATTAAINDIFHLRTSGAIDKKITFANLLGHGVLNTYLKGKGAGNQSIYEKLALRDTGVKIGYFDLSASGDIDITAVGFQPSVVVFLTINNSLPSAGFSIGFDNLTVHMMFCKNADSVNYYYHGSTSIRYQVDGANFIYGNISAWLSNGFTITASETGALIARVVYLALP